MNISSKAFLYDFFNFKFLGFSRFFYFIYIFQDVLESLTDGIVTFSDLLLQIREALNATAHSSRNETVNATEDLNTTAYACTIMEIFFCLGPTDQTSHSIVVPWIHDTWPIILIFDQSKHHLAEKKPNHDILGCSLACLPVWSLNINIAVIASCNAHVMCSTAVCVLVLLSVRFNCTKQKLFCQYLYPMYWLM